MHKLLIAVVLSLFATIANAAPSCMSKQSCIDSGKGYCHYTPTNNGRCWSADRAFLKKVKAGKMNHSKRKPRSSKEPKTPSEPRVLNEPGIQSEPSNRTEPSKLREPLTVQGPSLVSEPASQREPKIVSEPIPMSEPQQPSARGPIAKGQPRVLREPNHTSWDVPLLGIFTFASAFMGFTAARVLRENPLYWGKPTLPPPPLDLAKSPYRLIPGAAPDVLHLPMEHSMSLHLVAKPRWH